jgi:hypothetical protein
MDTSRTTRRGAIRPVTTLDPPRPLRARRGTALRIMIRPRAAARLLLDLAAEADLYRYAAGVVLKACACTHILRP